MLTMGSSSALYMNLSGRTGNQLIGIFQNLNKENNEMQINIWTGNRNCMHVSSHVNSQTCED